MLFFIISELFHFYLLILIEKSDFLPTFNQCSSLYFSGYGRGTLVENGLTERTCWYPLNNLISNLLQVWNCQKLFFSCFLANCLVFSSCAFRHRIHSSFKALGRANPVISYLHISISKFVGLEIYCLKTIK